jgi:hypothetical protein
MGSENELDLHLVYGKYFEAGADLADRVKAERTANIGKAQAYEKALQGFHS